MSVHTGHRSEDRLAEDIQGALQNKNYAGDVPNTHTLRELLMLSSVDMETSSSTSITALCTIDSSPAETLRSFERLLSFTREKDHTHKAEVSQILFPVFVHFYLDLLSSSHTDTALTLFSRHKDSVRSGHGSELKELSELTSPHHLHASPLVNKFRKQKFSLRMSSVAFHLLMQFLQVRYCVSIPSVRSYSGKRFGGKEGLRQRKLSEEIHKKCLSCYMLCLTIISSFTFSCY
jgi:hypothetical protein